MENAANILRSLPPLPKKAWWTPSEAAELVYAHYPSLAAPSRGRQGGIAEHEAWRRRLLRADDWDWAPEAAKCSLGAGIVFGLAGVGFWFFGLVALAFFAAAVTLPPAHWIRRRILMGLPGRLIYVESDDALMEHNAGVRGRPDAVVAVRRVFRDLRPVELKTTTATRPLTHHVVQLALEALLVQGAYGRYPRHGYLVYVSPNGTRQRHRVSLGPRARHATLAFLHR